MAKARKKAQPKQASPTVLAPSTVPPRRDLRPHIYVAIDQLFVIVYTYLLVAVIPNRLASAVVHLWALPVLMQLLALGTASAFVLGRDQQRTGWWLAIGAATGVLLVTVLLIIRVLISAAFLAGVYGAFGKGAAMSGLIGVALLVEVVALVPLLQLKYLRTRAGRRLYGMA